MDKYGLIGYPLTHSFSKQFFSRKFEGEGIDAEYINFELEDISLFVDLILSNPNLKGLNVTIPYKEQIIPYLDDLDDLAREIGAVNVVKIERTERGTRLIGYNSDVIGFKASIVPLIVKNIHQHALVLGTGGASKAVVKALNILGIDTCYVSRTAKEGVLTYDELSKEIMQEYKLIVNASPLGTFPNVEDAPTIPYQYLDARHLLYDLVYNPAETAFMRLGKEQGATVKNGADMLHIQALAAWGIWQKK